MKKKIYVFLFDGYADWEISYFSPEIEKSGKFDLIYFSKTGEPVTSMGGLNVKPSASLAEVDRDEAFMLILPGGNAWENGDDMEIVELTESLFEKGTVIAAICAATAFLGRQGILDGLKHTSNDLQYLKGAAPDYSDDVDYVNAPAVSDQNLITARGVSPIEFAREIFRKIGLYDDDRTEKWFQLFKNGVWSA